MKVLAGDLGGTKTLLALYACADQRCEALVKRRYVSAEFDGLEAMVYRFLEEVGVASEGVEKACLGVAGPLRQLPGGGQHATITNLPWSIVSTDLEEGLGLVRVRLINDFQAIGYAIEGLAPEQLYTLQAGEEERGGVRAVIGAGTGLGQAILYPHGEYYEVLSTEGGHVEFAPQDAAQVELLRWLWKRHEHVSYDRIVCGRGVVMLHEWLVEAGHPVGAELAEALASGAGDHAAAISAAALEGGDAGAVAALDLFASIYGAQAGNLALAGMAVGGLYVAGGIAPKILPKLADGAFMAAFNRKGRMSAVARRIPVRVVLDEEAGLTGAALAAARL